MMCGRRIAEGRDGGGEAPAASTMDLVCNRCQACGKECGRLVPRAVSGRGHRHSPAGGGGGGKPAYCSDKYAMRGAARARKAPARPATPRRRGAAGAGAGIASDIKALRRQLQEESAEHRRRVEADPRMIIHCHWCMREAQARLLDPDWWCAGKKRMVILLCSKCRSHVKKFMRARGYELVLTDNEGAARIMDEVAMTAPARAPAARSRGGARRRTRNA